MDETCSDYINLEIINFSVNRETTKCKKKKCEKMPNMTFVQPTVQNPKIFSLK